MKTIKGIIPPIITPMNPDESVNYDELKNQVERQIAAGVGGIFAFGTNGEAYILSPEEKKQVLKTVIETVNGRVPVYAGTGCVSTKETIYMSQMAEDMGADFLSVITPYFAAASQDELYTHYETLAKAVHAPIILYNIPARCTNALKPETVARLADIDNIVGAKDSSGNWDNMLAYIELTKGKNFSVISGNDALILNCLKAGGVGGIAGCANVFPHNMVRIYDAFIAGDMEAAEKAQQNIAIFRSVFKYGNPNTIVKTAVAELGFPVGKCRAPFNQISEEGMAALRQSLKDCIALGMD